MKIVSLIVPRRLVASLGILCLFALGVVSPFDQALAEEYHTPTATELPRANCNGGPQWRSPAEWEGRRLPLNALIHIPNVNMNAVVYVASNQHVIKSLLARRNNIVDLFVAEYLAAQLSLAESGSHWHLSSAFSEIRCWTTDRFVVDVPIIAYLTDDRMITPYTRVGELMGMAWELGSRGGNRDFSATWSQPTYHDAYALMISFLLLRKGWG
jgi:hypothetical protein